eukprot:CAMPEP_0202371082 /NCGR_PEP_ID=MMETSP1127-20130417/2561_1 /ASSEMBLY_ACC=CAM_ASM_000462 /TAXON_ID=3047 /ORGANISM="Dunaliella tertiolecta, Strain CCMP1320" /LENGTH=210 /DNA_ID=CAMNT_0048967215 /DNA_START=122 /DNA_END=754 /DNA_ORIENTATION=-
MFSTHSSLPGGLRAAVLVFGAGPADVARQAATDQEVRADALERRMQEQDRMIAELREAHAIALDSTMRKKEREQSLMAGFQSLSSRIGAAEREKEELARELGDGGHNMHGHVIMGSNPETQMFCNVLGGSLNESVRAGFEAVYEHMNDRIPGKPQEGGYHGGAGPSGVGNKRQRGKGGTSTQKGGGACFKCGQMGHKAADCKSPTQPPAQ